MTLKTFATRTGWPIEELLALRWSEFTEILSLMGMKMVFKKLPKASRDWMEEFR